MDALHLGWLWLGLQLRLWRRNHLRGLLSVGWTWLGLGYLRLKPGVVRLTGDCEAVAFVILHPPVVSLIVLKTVSNSHVVGYRGGSGHDCWLRRGCWTSFWSGCVVEGGFV